LQLFPEVLDSANRFHQTQPNKPQWQRNTIQVLETAVLQKAMHKSGIRDCRDPENNAQATTPAPTRLV